MVWFKSDDKLHSHPKAVRATAESRAALGLWIAAGSWCADQLTDGHVPRAMVPRLGFIRADAAALVAGGLWHVEPDGWVFHDWPDYQPLRADVLAEQEHKSAAKAAAGRAGGIASGKQRRSRAPSKGEAEHQAKRSPDPDPDPVREEAEPLSRPATAGHVAAEDVCKAWHACAKVAASTVVHDVDSWRREFAVAASGFNGTDDPEAAAWGCLAWFWLAPNGPIQTKRIRSPKPSHLAKYITDDLRAAVEWAFTPDGEAAVEQCRAMARPFAGVEAAQ